MEKTEWYPVSEKPVRAGWYEAKYDDECGTSMRWFDGEKWLLGPEFGLATFGNVPEFKDEWRGLTAPAK